MPLPFLPRATGVPVLLAALGAAMPAAPARAQSELADAEVSAPEPPHHASPLQRFDRTVVSRRLDSENLDERIRAIRRLGDIGGAQALELVSSYAVEHRARLTGREWLSLANALASGAGDAKIQLALAMVLNQAPNPAAGPDEAALLELGRGSAALALAAEGGPGASMVLGRALGARGAPARAASEALVAHPPSALEPLIDAGPPSVELAELLGTLGDQRAFHVLRDWVRGDYDNGVRAAAALALTRLGHLETVPLAARWLEAGPGMLAEAGLDILLAAHDPRAEGVLAERLAAERVGEADQRRLLDAAGPALAPAALASIDRAGAEPWRWTLLGRIGGDAAARRLGQALAAGGGAAFAAAHALSRMPGAAARASLEAALAEHAAVPLAVRAAAAQARTFGGSPRSLAERIDEALGSAVPSERAAGAWARALAGSEAAIAELRSGDEARVLAAASHAYGFDAAALEALITLLERSPPGAVRSAASACLATAFGRARVDSASLWSLVAEAGPGRPLALRALAARDAPGLRAALPALLADPDPMLRAHVARGLGESAEPSAVGMLGARLDVEPDDGVRHALVIALGSHRGRAVSRWLDRAARLDPSSGVRSAARLALAGVSLNDPPPGRELLWLELRAPSAPTGAAGDRAGHAVAAAAAATWVTLAPGLALPVLADPQGVLVVSGLPSPEVGIRLQ